MKELKAFLEMCQRRGGGSCGQFQNLIVMPSGRMIVVFSNSTCSFPSLEHVHLALEMDRTEGGK